MSSNTEINRTILAPEGQQNVTVWRNQKLVINKKNDCDSNFMKISNDEWMYAARDLKDSTFKLYMYLAKDKVDYRSALSPIAVKNGIGLSESTYRRAVAELIEKGYLMKQKFKGVSYDAYCFYSRPKDA